MSDALEEIRTRVMRGMATIEQERRATRNPIRRLRLRWQIETLRDAYTGLVAAQKMGWWS